MLTTERLILRQWQESDRSGLSKLNADTEVMKYFAYQLTEQESNESFDTMHAQIDQQGWGAWAVELADNHEFIGFVGLNKPDYPLPFSPCVEIAWRLAKEHWGHGYAPEAASEALRFGFQELKLNSIVAFTTLANRKSQRVMHKLGMTNTGKDFKHPSLHPRHPLALHCLFEMTKNQWLANHPLEAV